MNQHVGIALSAESATAKKQAPKRALRVSLVLSLIFCDLLALVAGLALAHFLRFSDVWPPAFELRLLAAVPIYCLSAVALRACTGEALISMTDAVRRGVLTVMLTAGMFVFLLFALQEADTTSRLVVTTGFVFAMALVIVSRVLHVLHARARLEGALYSVLVVHDGQFTTRIGSGLPVNLGPSFDPENASAEDYHRLAGILSAADRVVVRCAPERRDSWAHVLQGMNVHAEIVAPEITQTRAIAIGSYAGRPTYVVARGPLSLRNRLIKRAFDIVAAGSALLLLFPTLILVALAIKLESPGPVFFKQKRIGRQNRLFDIYKFRSMRTEQCDANGTRSASRDDDRITRVGRILRMTSIDELPQLINVLKGDMSIVGPRPHAVHSTAKSKLFWEVDQRYWYRHACKPGITGLAQVRGFRGATHEERDLTDRLEADLEYLSNWSFWNDLAIIVRTAAVLMHRNAY